MDLRLSGRLVAVLLLPALLAATVASAEPQRKRTALSVVAQRPAASGVRAVGLLRLEPCGPAWCGKLVRVLDPAGEVPGSVGIAFEFYPQRDASRPNAGTIVAAEGGPGYPSTASRAGYLGLFEPLLADRHLLLVDNRGTGRSGALDCPALQQDPFYAPVAVAACGAQLGANAALYGSALAADDLAAVLDALQLGRVDLYGDSYGTFFAQAFAGRHPDRLRSIVLDSAYPVVGGDPWYPEAAPAARAAFDAVCQRTPECASLSGSSSQRIAALLESLRVRPVSGVAPDGDGHPRDATADARGLAYAMFSNASGPLVYRELDAAARAWALGDTAPLLRLVAENQTAAVSANGAERARDFSAALFTAVSCADYPQVFDAAAPLPQRRRQAQAAIAAKRVADPDVFAPFSIDEFLSLPQDYSVVTLCLPWPVPSPLHPPGRPVPAGAAFPGVPVLVLSGELDSLTPAAQGAQAAALFPAARQVIVANSFHVTAAYDLDGCASTLVRRFVATLDVGDTSCAAAVPAYPLLTAFARRAAELAVPQPADGNRGSSADLQRAAAAVLAAADALARWWINFDGDGVGLRGGVFSYRSAGPLTSFTLDGLRWTEDVAVSGELDWNLAEQRARARLRLADGTLRAEWPTRGSGGRASFEGVLAGRRVAGTLPAP